MLNIIAMVILTTFVGTALMYSPAITVQMILLALLVLGLTSVKILLKEKTKDTSARRPPNVGDQSINGGADGGGDDVQADTPKSPDASAYEQQAVGTYHHIAPGDRGGGSREERERASRDEKQVQKKSSRPKFQLIASHDSGDWEILVEFVSVDPSKVRLLQGGASLQQLSESEPLQFGPLRDLSTPLQILCDGAEATEKNLVTEDPPLFFHVQGSLARSVPRPSRGLNLAVTPSQWQYNELISGAPPIAPESCAVSGYSVHFFSAETNPILAFERPGTAPVKYDCAKPEFQLNGRCLPDAEDKMGPLFVGDLPVLHGDASAINRVRAIVLGAEGLGTGRWRKQYDRIANDSEQWPLPDDVRTQGAGWYFIRLYDDRDVLIDSFDFRYIGGLKSIKVEGAGLKQGLSENEVRATFVHNEGLTVSMTDAMPPQVQTVREPQSTVFSWSCHPNVPKAVFEVCERGRPVRVTLDTDRIWWTLVNGSQASVWQSSPIPLTPDHFAPVSEAELLIRFPRSTAVDALVGFQREDRRAIKISASGQASICLHAFSEAPELRRFGAQKFGLWVRNNGSECELDVANVDVSMKCPWCETRISEQEEMFCHLLNEHHAQFEGRGGGRTRGYICLPCTGMWTVLSGKPFARAESH